MLSIWIESTWAISLLHISRKIVFKVMNDVELNKLPLAYPAKNDGD